MIHIRKQFPLFKNHPRLVYLDSAATSQKPGVVIAAEKEWYEMYNANAHRGSYGLAEKATQHIENSRKVVADFIHAPKAECIVFTKGATEALNMIARSWAENNLKRGDVILLSEMEHHSNIVPWQLLAQRMQLTLRYWHLTKDGQLQPCTPGLLKGVKLLSLCHISNVLGTINPIQKIFAHAKKQGIVTVLDACQSVGHMDIDVKKLNVDFCVFSGHKVLGPTGIGVLYVAPTLHGQLEPYQGGGHMIKEVTQTSVTFRDMPALLEAGTLPLAQIYGLSVALIYIKSIGIPAINKHCSAIAAYALRCLSALSEVVVYGPVMAHRSHLISFNLNGVHPHDLATWLDQDSIAIRAGHHCAQPLHITLAVPATARISFHVYNSIDDVDKFIRSLKKIIAEWKKV
jgi:cysteine desulfurase/selenocysteine lyase